MIIPSFFRHSWRPHNHHNRRHLSYLFDRFRLSSPILSFSSSSLSSSSSLTIRLVNFTSTTTTPTTTTTATNTTTTIPIIDRISDFSRNYDTSGGGGDTENSDTSIAGSEITSEIDAALDSVSVPYFDWSTIYTDITDNNNSHNITSNNLLITNATTTTTTAGNSTTSASAAVSASVASTSLWWSQSAAAIYRNPDILLAFALIIFYAVFVLFIAAIIIRIVVAIVTSGNAFQIPPTSSDALYGSDTIDGDDSVCSRGGGGGNGGGGGAGGTQSISRSYPARCYAQREFTSFAMAIVERTDSPSVGVEDDDRYEDEDHNPQPDSVIVQVNS